VKLWYEFEGLDSAMSDIFISYNHEDQLRAQELARALEGRGWSIFWDRTIPIGKTWPETIGKELSEARCVVVLWLKTSIESGWVREEADDAKARRILIPVRIDNIQPPIGFRGIQTADLVNWNATEPTPAFSRLTADIAMLIGSTPMKEPPWPAATKEPPSSPSLPPERERPQSLPPISSPPAEPNSVDIAQPSRLPIYLLGVFAALIWPVGLSIIAFANPGPVNDRELRTFFPVLVFIQTLYGLASAGVWIRTGSAKNLGITWLVFLIITWIAMYIMDQIDHSILGGSRDSLGLLIETAALTAVSFAFCAAILQESARIVRYFKL
jgi:hypothetical protein